MKQAPWILGGAVLFGTAFGTLSFSIPFPAFIFIAAGLALVLLRSFRGLSQQPLLLAFIFALGTFWYAQNYTEHFDTLEPLEIEQKEYSLVTFPEEKSFYSAVYLRSTECPPLRCREPKVLWQAPLTFEGSPGERVTLSCDLTIPENFSDDFDYRRYLAKEGVGYICKEALSFEKTVQTERNWYAILYSPRLLMEGAIQKSIPEPEAGLAKGLLLGGSNHMSATVRTEFTNLGLTHIVAVSGYNIVLIVGGLLFFGLALGLWRKQATLFAFVGIILFIIIIGSPASAVRAGIMALAAFGAFLIGRITYSLLAVWLTASLMVLYNPLYLWYDAGFQLSFLATIGVILAMRSVEEKLATHTFVRSLQEVVWLSVWVYLFLLPLLLLQFKTLTILSIPANILFLPAVPLAMLATFTVALVTLIAPPLAVIVGWAAYLPLTYIMRGTHFLSSLPDITVPVTVPLALVIAWYILLFFVIVQVEARRRTKNYETIFTCPHHH